MENRVCCNMNLQKYLMLDYHLYCLVINIFLTKGNVEEFFDYSLLIVKMLLTIILISIILIPFFRRMMKIVNSTTAQNHMEHDSFIQPGLHFKARLDGVLNTYKTYFEQGFRNTYSQNNVLYSYFQCTEKTLYKVQRTFFPSKQSRWTTTHFGVCLGSSH